MAGTTDWGQDFAGLLGDGTVVSTTNLTGDQFCIVSGSTSPNTAEIDTGAPLAGTRSLRLVKGTGSTTRTRLYAYLGTGSSTFAFRTRLRMVGARPAVSETIMRAYTGGAGTSTPPSANRFDLLITSTGKLQIIDSQVGGSNATSTGALNADTTYWVELLYTAAGVLTANAYTIGSVTKVATCSLSTLPTSLVINEAEIGLISASASNLELLMDDVGFGHGDYLTRLDIATVPPAVVAQADRTSPAGGTVTLTATATATSPATLTSIAYTCTSTTAPGVSAGSVTFTNTNTLSGQTGSTSSVTTGTLAAGTYVMTATVTDSNGQTGTDTVTVWVDTTSAKPESVVTVGGGTVTGAADAVTALGDASDSSYVTFTAPATNVSEYKVSPVRSGAIVVTVRAKVSTGTGTILIELWEGSTNRSPGRSAQSLTTSFAAYTLTLTSPEYGAITDFSNLRVRVTENV